jgi:hypothetical protein
LVTVTIYTRNVTNWVACKIVFAVKGVTSFTRTSFRGYAVTINTRMGATGNTSIIVNTIFETIIAIASVR